MHCSARLRVTFCSYEVHPHSPTLRLTFFFPNRRRGEPGVRGRREPAVFPALSQRRDAERLGVGGCRVPGGLDSVSNHERRGRNRPGTALGVSKIQAQRFRRPCLTSTPVSRNGGTGTRNVTYLPHHRNVPLAYSRRLCAKYVTNALWRPEYALPVCRLPARNYSHKSRSRD